MHIKATPAKLQDEIIILNLGRYYEYDMSLYCGDLPGWEFPENDEYRSEGITLKLKSYFTEPNHYPFLIRVNSELAGFAMVYRPTDPPVTDWRIGEFFILNKFKGKGIGQTVAHQLFGQFQGKWSVPVIPQNQGALAFWRKAIQKHVSGAFTENYVTLYDPNPIEMLILQFESRIPTTDDFSGRRQAPEQSAHALTHFGRTSKP
ncbi:MAG: GNAT family N-acetyltransferase [Gammaproteobacteria bacterium]